MIRINLPLKLVLLTYFIIAPIHKQPAFPEGVWLGFKLTLLGLICALVTMTFLFRKKINFGSLDISFLICVTISAFFLLSGDVIFSVIALAFLFFFLGRNISTEVGAKEFISVLIWAARFSALYIVFMLISNFGGTRADISGGINPNSWALYVAISASSLLYSYYKDNRLFDLTLFLIVTGSILYSGSRGGLLLVVLMLALFLIVQRKWRVILYGAAISGLATFVIANAEFFSDTRVYAQIIMWQQGGEVDITTGRWEGYVTALNIMGDNILTGVGPVNLYNYGFKYSQIHNYFLKIYVEKGLAFLAPLLILIGLIAYRLVRIKGELKLLSYFCLTLLLVPLFYEPSGLFGNFMIGGQLWLTIGYLSCNAGACKPPAKDANIHHCSTAAT